MFPAGRKLRPGLVQGHALRQGRLCVSATDQCGISAALGAEFRLPRRNLFCAEGVSPGVSCVLRRGWRDEPAAGRSCGRQKGGTRHAVRADPAKPALFCLFRTAARVFPPGNPGESPVRDALGGYAHENIICN